MKIVLLFVLCLVFSGCYRSSEESVKSSNPEVTVEKLFEHDGCTIYRFYDGGIRYFANCGSRIAIFWSEVVPCGKGCMYWRHYQM